MNPPWSSDCKLILVDVEVNSASEIILYTLFEAIDTKTVTADPPYIGDTKRGRFYLKVNFIWGRLLIGHHAIPCIKMQIISRLPLRVSPVKGGSGVTVLVPIASNKVNSIFRYCYLMHGEERYSTTSANLTISALRRLRVKVWKKANGFTKMKLNVFRFRFVDVKRLSRPTNAIHPSHPPRIANPSEKFQTRKWVAGEEFSCLFENN